MNRINKIILKLALLPAGLYRRLGVNTTHLNAILATKLLMDDRRPNTLHQTRQRRSEKPVTAATIGTILVSALMGLVYLIAFGIGENNTTHFLFYFSFFFFMLAASLISDFTAVLIDVRDNYIILPRPVSDRTVVTARILHIFIHICKLVVPMCLPGLVYVVFQYSAAGAFYFLVLVLLLTLFVIFFINALYLLILRITTPARFQNIISYIQIGFAIALYASYQILPRMAERIGVMHFDATTHPALFVLPMYWFASAWDTLYTMRADSGKLLLLLLCVAVPLASLYVVIKYLAPSFNNKLALLNSAGAEGQKPTKTETTTTSPYVRALSRFATKKGAERMGFLFTWKLTSRSRDFKVRVYPSIGYLAVIVVMLFLRKNNMADVAHMDAQRAKMLLLSALYVTSFLLITAVTHMTQSEKFKASWLYFIAPVETPGRIISGAVKAVLFKFYVPVLVVIAIGALYLLGISALPNLLLGFCNQGLIILIIVYGNNRLFPFSIAPSNKAMRGTFFKNIMLLSISGLIGFGQYLVYSMPLVVLIFTVLSALAGWFLLGSIKDTNWKQIEQAYAATG